jgi:hypothetical protein
MGSGGSSPLSLSASRFAAAVTAATRAAGTADVALTDDITGGQCIRDARPSAAGSVSFAAASMEVSSVPGGCDDQSGLLHSVQVAGTYFSYSAHSLANGRTYAPRWQQVFPAVGEVFVPDPIGHLVSPSPWRILDALNGRVRKVGEHEIRGVRTTEYAGDATFASLIAVYPSIRDELNGVPRTTPLSLLRPAATRLRIPIEVWLDAQHRIRRIQASEPSFAATIPGSKGATLPGPDLPTTMRVSRAFLSGTAGHIGDGPQMTVRLGPVRETSTTVVRLDLYDFGTSVRITSPIRPRGTA